MKIDTHVHSSGISLCSKITYQKIVEEKLKKGVDGAVLMNHCQPWYYKPEEYKQWMEKFIEEFNNAYEYGKERGFTFFMGIEVSVNIPRWADFLIFGVTEDFLRNSPDLCKLNQEDLYKYCVKYGALMVQAHPYRPNFEPLDPKFMDGVEINMQLRDDGTRPLVEKFAQEHGLLITVGTDYHEPYVNDCAGIIIPNEIKDSVALCDYLKNSEKINAFIGDKEFTLQGYTKK